MLDVNQAKIIGPIPHHEPSMQVWVVDFLADDKKAYFALANTDLSQVLSGNKNFSARSLIADQLSRQELNEKLFFDGIGYFVFTGSHFQQMDKVPEWVGFVKLD